jgi:lipopolysaccharide export LptBFGC system permease protein LptF
MSLVSNVKNKLRCSMFLARMIVLSFIAIVGTLAMVLSIDFSSFTETVNGYFGTNMGVPLLYLSVLFLLNFLLKKNDEKVVVR